MKAGSADPTCRIRTMDQVASILGLSNARAATRWLDRHAAHLKRRVGKIVYVLVDELEEFVCRRRTVVRLCVGRRSWLEAQLRVRKAGRSGSSEASDERH